MDSQDSEAGSLISICRDRRGRHHGHHDFRRHNRRVRDDHRPMGALHGDVLR
ncbi:MAG: hypothetical protein VXV91_02280 [Verrucomicrobiota bacterium]|nr:hypothetical protein [Verrucomicrobiota bacterium]